jgi:hypothetical protein
MTVTYTSTSAPTYECLANYVGIAAASTVTFSNIPSTYTDLVISHRMNFNTAQGMNIYINGDNGTNYWRCYAQVGNYMSGPGWQLGFSTAAASSNSTILGSPAGQYARIHILQYANTNNLKTLFAMGGYASTYAALGAATWNSTAAITSLTFSIGTNSVFPNGIALYGIKAA